MGTQRVLERLNAPNIPISNSDGNVTTWSIGQNTYRLQLQEDTQEYAAAEDVCEPFHAQLNGTGCWAIGDSIICKIQVWSEDAVTEAENIEFVRANVEGVPLPAVYDHWVDTTLRRSFVLMERVPGETLAEVWPQCSAKQKNILISELVEIITNISKKESDHFEDIKHYPPVCIMPILGKPNIVPELFIPYYPRYNCAQYNQRIEELWGYNPYSVTKFHLHHSDPHPKNIIVSKPTGPTSPVHITAIIDWEGAHYAPWWTFPFLPCFHPDFNIEHENLSNPHEFAGRLFDRLVSKYFELHFLQPFIAQQ